MHHCLLLLYLKQLESKQIPISTCRFFPITSNMSDTLAFDDTGPCVEAFVNHYSFKSWEQWSTEYLDRWSRNYTRSYYFNDIVHTLSDDYWSNGYKFIYSNYDLTSKLMIWAYTIDKEHSQHYGTRLIIPDPKHRNSDKDRYEYDQKFQDFTVANFYSKKFNDEALFNSNIACDYFWNNLAYFLYRLIDITNSPYIKRYDAEAAKEKEEEIERLLHEGVLTIDARGRLKKTDKTDMEEYDRSHYRD